MAKPSIEEEKQAVKPCTKCGDFPRAAQNSSNTWCLECNASYMEVWRARNIDRAHKRGFVEGCAAMRTTVATMFRFYRAAHFSGEEIASKVEQMPAPSTAEPVTVGAPHTP